MASRRRPLRIGPAHHEEEGSRLIRGQAPHNGMLWDMPGGFARPAHLQPDEPDNGRQKRKRNRTEAETLQEGRAGADLCPPREERHRARRRPRQGQEAQGHHRAAQERRRRRRLSRGRSAEPADRRRRPGRGAGLGPGKEPVLPSRILRESIVTSESVASLEPDVQDRLPRYFLLADDFGCFLASAPIIHGHIYPLRPDVTHNRIEDDLKAFADVGIVQLYLGPDGRQYGCFPNWTTHQRPARPSSKRKYPKPPKPGPGGVCQEFPANAGKSPPELLPASPANAGKILPYAQSQSFDRSRVDPQSQSPAKREEPARPSESPWDPEVLFGLREYLGKQDTDPDWLSFLAATAKMPRSRD